MSYMTAGSSAYGSACPAAIAICSHSNSLCARGPVALLAKTCSFNSLLAAETACGLDAISNATRFDPRAYGLIIRPSLRGGIVAVTPLVPGFADDEEAEHEGPGIGPRGLPNPSSSGVTLLGGWGLCGGAGSTRVCLGGKRRGGIHQHMLARGVSEVPASATTIPKANHRPKAFKCPEMDRSFD